MIGSTLKDARTNTNLSQYDMADRLGVTKQTYMKWENDITEPKASQIVKLAEILGITEAEICKGKLNKRYSLEDFIYKLAEEGTSRELQVLHMWKAIPNHEEFFNQLSPKSKDEALELDANERYIHEKSEEAYHRSKV